MYELGIDVEPTRRSARYDALSAVTNPSNALDECRESIDTEVPLAPYWRPMHVVPDPGYLRQPYPRRREVLQPPIGRHEQRDTQLRLPIEKPLSTPEGACRKVAARFIFQSRQGINWSAGVSVFILCKVCSPREINPRAQRSS